MMRTCRHGSGALVLIGAAVLALGPVPEGRCAASPDGVTKVQAETGEDPAALARRMTALEEKLAAMWSLRMGPEVLHVDGLDRMSTRLLAAEARLASVEEALGLRQARAAHAHGGGAFDVAMAILLLADADWSAASSTPAHAVASLPLRDAVLAAPWPAGLRAKSQQLETAWLSWSDAASRADASAAAEASRSLALIRRDLTLAASNWVATMRATEGKPHDHSGLGEAAHADHSPHHAGQVAMQGDVHVELVSEGPGRWRAHLTDAFRQPLPAGDWSGELLLFPDDEEPRRIPLAVAGDDRSLEGVGEPAERAPVEVGVRLEAPEALAGALGPAARASGSRSVATDFTFLSEGPGGTGDAATEHPPDCPMNPARLGQAAEAPAEAGRPASRPRRWR